MCQLENIKMSDFFFKSCNTVDFGIEVFLRSLQHTQFNQPEFNDDILQYNGASTKRFNSSTTQVSHFVPY